MTATSPRYTLTVQEVAIEAEPLSISQHTCERVTGIPPERFLDLVRAGVLQAVPVGHDRIVLLAHVREWLTKELAAPKPRRKPPARKKGSAPSIDDIMAAGGAKRAG